MNDAPSAENDAPTCLCVSLMDTSKCPVHGRKRAPLEDLDGPVNVRLVDADGVEHPVDCRYVDTTPEGTRRWYVMAPPGSWRGLRADALPGMSELIFHTDVPPGGETHA